MGETVFRRRALPAAGALVAGDPPAALSAAPPTMVSHTFTLRPRTPPAPCSNLSLLFVLPLSLSRARSQFSIAAINESDSGGQWEPLAPTKEAQVGILLLPSLLSLRTCHHPKILVVCFFSFWVGMVRASDLWKAMCWVNRVSSVETVSLLPCQATVERS